MVHFMVGSFGLNFCCLSLGVANFGFFKSQEIFFINFENHCAHSSSCFKFPEISETHLTF